MGWPGGATDWVEWHRDYDDPGALLSRRLELVQGTWVLSPIMPPGTYG